jgi:uncharacterized protein (DUF302 family)
MSVSFDLDPATNSSSPNQKMTALGLRTLPSHYSVHETVDRLEGLLKSKGIKIFARIDQAAEAQAVGLSMRPTELLIFGDPKSGTPLMNEYPSLAIDLPFKTVAWESADAKVYLSFNSAEYLIERHHLAGEPFKALEALSARAVE